MTTPHAVPKAWGTSLADGLRALDDAKARFAEVFTTTDCTVEIYAPLGHDLQKPHDRDELYFVARGSGEFFDGSARRPVGPGTALFVAAGVPHRFEGFTPDFAVWVVFVGPSKAAAVA